MNFLTYLIVRKVHACNTNISSNYKSKLAWRWYPIINLTTPSQENSFPLICKWFFPLKSNFWQIILSPPLSSTPIWNSKKIYFCLTKCSGLNIYIWRKVKCSFVWMQSHQSPAKTLLVLLESPQTRWCACSSFHNFWTNRTKAVIFRSTFLWKLKLFKKKGYSQEVWS